MSWPDGGSTPFRGEKDTNWEGGWRVPFVMRWPGVIKPGRVINDICSLQDMIPTFAAAAGEPDLVEKVKKGYKIGGKTFKVHLDGDNLLPFLKGDVEKSSARGLHLLERRRRTARAFVPASGRSSFSSSAQHGPRRLARAVLAAARAQDLQSAHGSVRSAATTSFFYDKWMVDRAFLLVPAQAIAAKWLETFKEFPIRQKPASFSLENVVQAATPHP